MGLKTRLSEFSREKLAQNYNKEWFQELLEVLRNTGAWAERTYTNAARPLTEMEHQALNGSYRQGFVNSVEYIAVLADAPREKPEPLSAPFGTLVKDTPNPKSLPTPQKASQ